MVVGDSALVDSKFVPRKVDLSKPMNVPVLKDRFLDRTQHLSAPAHELSKVLCDTTTVRVVLEKLPHLDEVPVTVVTRGKLGDQRSRFERGVISVGSDNAGWSKCYSCFSTDAPDQSR